MRITGTLTDYIQEMWSVSDYCALFCWLITEKKDLLMKVALLELSAGVAVGVIFILRMPYSLHKEKKEEIGWTVFVIFTTLLLIVDMLTIMNSLVLIERINWRRILL